MKKIILLLFTVSALCMAQESKKTIRGTVTDGYSSMKNVAITIQGGSERTFTDAKGTYTVEASVGDVLVYSYQGMKSVKIKVEDVTLFLNITMIPNVEALDEVTVVGRKTKSQRDLEREYAINKNIIRTAYGFIDGERAPGHIRFMGEEEINPVALCILDLLKNQFAGVRVEGSCIGASGGGATLQAQVANSAGGTSDAPGTIGSVQTGGSANFSGAFGASAVGTGINQGRVFIRGNGSLFNSASAVFDVDGQIFRDAPIWIDIKNIKRLAILSNFATTATYGSLGAGGVIVVNTISSGATPKDGLTDVLRLRNNYVNEKVLGAEEIKRNWPNYLVDIHKTTSVVAAKEVYAKYKKMYASSPYFVLDMQHYFVGQWNEKAFADSLITEHQFLFENNPLLLKALAYQYETFGDLEKANDLYKKIFKLRPDYMQSYRDLANNYRDLKDYVAAAGIYTRFDYLREQGLMLDDPNDFLTIMEREHNNFLLFGKSSLVKGDKGEDLYIEEEGFNGTRLVFEWNDGEAEFDLQFVNPGNQHYTLQHTMESNAEMIALEKEHGYSSLEYLVDNALPGTWKINIRYHGNKSLTPTYLKTTIYYNYGSFAQRKEIKVFKLNLKGKNQALFKLSVGSKLVSN